MNIVFLSRLFYPHIGGVEKHVENLSLELIKRNHQITIITEQYEGSLNTIDTYKNIQILRIPRNALTSKYSTWQWIQSKKDIFQTADLIHAHDVFWWYLPLKFQLKTPIFTTFHGWEGDFPIPKKSKLWRKMAEKLSYGNICIGEYITTWYGTKPNVILYGATNQQKLPLGDKNRILVFGRLSRDNDIPIILKSLTKIKERLPEIKVTFLGDGEMAWEAKDIGHVLGFQPNIEDYLAQAQWVIASSYLSILDSIAAGRQVFSVYSNPLKQDYLTQTPFSHGITISRSSKQLTRKFTTMYNDQTEHVETLSSAYPFVKQLTWESLANQYENLWTDRSYSFAYKQLNQDLNQTNP